MARSSTSSVELLLDLEARTETTRSARIQGALRDAIRLGRLEAGRLLPSSRSLAADLGVSRGLVVEVYEQLVAEGYLFAEHGSGTRIAQRIAHERGSATEAPKRRRWTVDFEPGTPDVAAFPRSTWASALRAALGDLTAEELGYGDPKGDANLRRELAAYLGRVRGADIAPDCLLIVGGFTQGLGLLGRAMSATGSSRVAVEEPGAYVQRQVLTDAGLELLPTPLDDRGIVVADIDASCNAVMVTPAHQYPTGVVLDPARRSELLAWVGSHPKRLVIEDDYDAEFRYDRAPIGSLQGLRPDNVVLGGSVSKSLAPGLRLGWIGVPRSMVDVVAQIQQTQQLHPSIVSQRAFAHLLATGRYDRHIRRMRTRYRQRRDAVVTILADIAGVSIRGVSAGLHLVVLLPESVDEDAVAAIAAEADIFARPLSHYRMSPGPAGLVIGYAHLTPQQIDRGASVLRDAISTVRGDSPSS